MKTNRAAPYAVNFYLDRRESVGAFPSEKRRILNLVSETV